jgi:hypothetical protein
MAQKARYVTVCVKEQDGAWRDVPNQVLGSMAMFYLLCPECHHVFYSPMHLWVSHRWNMEKAENYVKEQVKNGNGQMTLVGTKTYYQGEWKIKGKARVKRVEVK